MPYSQKKKAGTSISPKNRQPSTRKTWTLPKKIVMAADFILFTRTVAKAPPSCHAGGGGVARKPQLVYTKVQFADEAMIVADYQIARRETTAMSLRRRQSDSSMHPDDPRRPKRILRDEFRAREKLGEWQWKCTAQKDRSQTRARHLLNNSTPKCKQ